MAKVNFTSARVEAFTCPDESNQVFLWDSRAPGLGLRATKAGAKAYIFQAKFNGSTIRTTVGNTRSWTLSGAQEEARRLQTLIDRGIDPREQKIELQAAHASRQAEARRKTLTLGEAWDEYVESRKPFWGELHHRDHVQLAAQGGLQRLRSTKLTQPGPIASLRNVRLADLTGKRMGSWLAEESAIRPTRTALAFRLLRGFIRWTHDVPTYSGLVPDDSYSARVVKDTIPRARAKHGDVLQREQLSAWFKGVRSLPNPVVSVYLQGLLLTGARREELAMLTWEDVDFEWNSLSLHDKIEGTGGRVIPLTPYFKKLLLELKRTSPVPNPSKTHADQSRLQGTQNNWVFKSPTAADGRIADPRSAHVRALSIAGLPHLTIHGLRRSFGTLSEWCDVPVGVVAQIQGHKPSALAEKHYRRRPLDLLRQWHEKIETWMLEQSADSTSPKASGNTS